MSMMFQEPKVQSPLVDRLNDLAERCHLNIDFGDSFDLLTLGVGAFSMLCIVLAVFVSPWFLIGTGIATIFLAF